nr:uncharacterized protein CTRU02_11491 [Colletotrichum truncatum]KAF6785866.1 hypothetical protein CTRU02_11491 [Colletotrichum truncatum]
MHPAGYIIVLKHDFYNLLKLRFEEANQRGYSATVTSAIEKMAGLSLAQRRAPPPKLNLEANGQELQQDELNALTTSITPKEALVNSPLPGASTPSTPSASQNPAPAAGDASPSRPASSSESPKSPKSPKILSSIPLPSIAATSSSSAGGRATSIPNATETVFVTMAPQTLTVTASVVPLATLDSSSNDRGGYLQPSVVFIDSDCASFATDSGIAALGFLGGIATSILVMAAVVMWRKRRRGDKDDV